MLLFLEKNNMKILNWNSFSSSKCSLFGVSCLVFSLKSLFLIFVFFLILSYVFCSTSLFLVSKTQVEKHIFSKKGGLQQNGFFFMNLCFAKCQKLSFFFWDFFLDFLGCFSKNTIKIGILAHFSKQTITKKMAFLEVIIWSKLEVIIWSKLTAS